MVKYPSTPGSSSLPRMEQADDCEDQPWFSGQHYPLRRHQKLFPNKISKSSYPKPSTLSPTSHTPDFIQQQAQTLPRSFVADANPSTEPSSYPTCFYIFEDVTSPQILLSYATSERLGILESKSPTQLHNPI